MASFSVSCDETTVTMRVTGLAKGQTVRFYVRINPGSTAYVDSTYTATSSSMTKTFRGLKAGTDYACNVNLDGKAWIGTQYFTTDEASIPRPDDWYWSGVGVGYTVSISAGTWNSFCSRINEFRRYKGLSNYSFTRVYSGSPMFASQVNEAWNAINEISGHGSMPSRALSGASMAASFMIGLQNALNNIR